MNEQAASSVVGVVGTETERVCAALEDAGATVRQFDGPIALPDGVDTLVAVGESALLDLPRGDTVPEMPVLPVDAGPGVGSVPRSAVDSASRHLVAGDCETRSVPVLRAATDGTERARALCDLLLVTAEPARISEYSVTSAETPVSQFRADGVIVATAVGSHGYARSVGGPVLDHRTDVVATAPVAPFATDADHWVLPEDSVTLRVERDEVPVELLADDRRVGRLDPFAELSISTAERLTLCAVPESRPPFDVPV